MSNKQSPRLEISLIVHDGESVQAQTLHIDYEDNPSVFLIKQAVFQKHLAAASKAIGEELFSIAQGDQSVR